MELNELVMFSSQYTRPSVVETVAVEKLFQGAGNFSDIDPGNIRICLG